MVTVTVLGSGGNFPLPTPTCECRLCVEARSEGIPYARHGNNLYIEDLSAVVDAPEFVFENLNRAGIEEFSYLFLTHWHPDHTAGLRVVQSRPDASLFDDPDRGIIDTARSDVPTLVTTERVFERTCELYDGLRHFSEMGYVETHFLDDDPLVVDGIRVEAIPYSLSGNSDMDATAFVLSDGDTTAVLAPDDARYLDEAALPDDIDLAVFECGYFEQTPDGTPILADADAAVFDDELTHGEVLARIDRLAPERTLLTEIEHIYARSHDQLQALADGYDGIEFAYDGVTVDASDGF